MLLTSLIAGGTLYAGARMYKEHQKKKKYPWSYHLARMNQKNRRKRVTLTDIQCNHGINVNKEQKQQLSLYSGMIKVTEALKLDQLVPVSRQIQEESFRPKLSPWENLANEKQAVVGEASSEHLLGVDWHLFWRYISKYGRPYWVVGTVSGLCLISFSIYEMAFAYASKIAYDSLIAGQSIALIIPIFMKLIIAAPLVLFASIVGAKIYARLGSRMVQDMLYDAFEHLQILSLDFHYQTKLGDILARFSSDTDYMRLGIGKQLIPATVDILTLMLNFAFLFWLEWHLALVSLLPIPIIIIVVQKISQHLSYADLAMKNQQALMVNSVQEGVRAQPIVKSFGIHKFIQDSFLMELKKEEDIVTDVTFSSNMLENIIVMSLFSFGLMSTSVGLLLIWGGYISVSTLVTFMMIQTSLNSKVRNFLRIKLRNLIRAGTGIKRFDLLFQKMPNVFDVSDAIELPAFCEAIRFEHVSFTYTESSYQLNQVSFTIESGKFVAFVGLSGAGKSTILNLLLRFYDVTEGRITIDGYDIRQVTQKSLRAQMGIVLQDNFVFNTTILNNIRVVKPTASKDEVIAAAKAAELHDFIMSLPDGYQSHVGEAGGFLSGGQKQRIAIARAMLRDPAILILDEATSHLDAKTATAINATIHELAKERTVISISHHLASVTEADQIFVVDKGCIVEQGTHQELLSQFGLYAQMWHTQATSKGVQSQKMAHLSALGSHSAKREL